MMSAPSAASSSFPELRNELHQRIEAGPCSFYVLVPNTSAAHYHVVPAAGGFVPMPTVAVHYGVPASGEEATAQARQRLGQTLADLAAMMVQADGDLGSANPLEAIEKTLVDHQFDEIIVTTLPRRFSRWLKLDLPEKAGRRFGLPVTTVTAKR